MHMNASMGSLASQSPFHNVFI